MRHPTNKQLFAHWRSLRGSAPAPERAQIDPTELAAGLGDIFILEEIGGEPIYRLSGSRVALLFGGELRGSPFFDPFTTDDRAALARRLPDICAAGAGLLADLRATTEIGRSFMVELLILPLIQRERIGARMIGAFAAFDAPAWIARDPVASIRLERATIAMPELDMAAPASQAIGAPPLAAPQRRMQRFLRVIDGGR